jgi:hypothetical protein
VAAAEGAAAEARSKTARAVAEAALREEVLQAALARAQAAAEASARDAVGERAKYAEAMLQRTAAEDVLRSQLQKVRVTKSLAMGLLPDWSQRWMLLAKRCEKHHASNLFLNTSKLPCARQTAQSKR